MNIKAPICCIALLGIWAGPDLGAETGKISDDPAHRDMEVAQGEGERIDLEAVALIRRFGHEIRFDDLYISLCWGKTGEEGNEEQFRFSFLKFGFVLLKDGLVFDDHRYYPLPPKSVVTISDHGRTVSIGGVEKESKNLPDELGESLVRDREIEIAPGGLKLEVAGSIGRGGVVESFGPGRWIRIFGVTPVRIWNGELYVGRKHLGKMAELVTNNRILLDARTATVLKSE